MHAFIDDEYFRRQSSINNVASMISDELSMQVKCHLWHQLSVQVKWYGMHLFESFLLPQVDEVGRSFPGPKPNTGSISKEGGFEFIAPNQQRYRIDYVADEGGFQPRGAHLPQPPAQIPEYAQLRQKYPQLFGV